MRVLITGGSGFIGRHLAQSAAERGHEVVATYLAPSELSAKPPLPSGVRWEPLDLQDRARVDALVESTRADAVFHLGAQAYAGKAWSPPPIRSRRTSSGPSTSTKHCAVILPAKERSLPPPPRPTAPSTGFR